MPALSADGYIRITRSALAQVQLTHFFSAEERADCIAAPTNAPTHFGYTEWVSQDQPTVSLGWDWSLTWIDHQPYCRTLLVPRSNIMLINDQGDDLGRAYTADALLSYISGLPWDSFIINTVRHYHTSSNHLS